MLLVGLIVYGFLDTTPPRPNFTAYESALPLNGASLLRSEVDVLTEGAFFTYDYAAYVQEYSSGVGIIQRADQGQHVYEGCKDRLYINSPPEYLRYECNDGTIKNSGEYTIIRTFYDDGQSNIQVYALINDTSMVINIPDDMKTEFENYDGWQEFFSAMQSKDITPDHHPGILERIIEFLYPQMQS